MAKGIFLSQLRMWILIAEYLDKTVLWRRWNRKFERGEKEG